MLFILIYSIYSEYILDLTGILEPGNLVLSIYPLDIIKVKIPKGLGTFFSNWKSEKGLKLDVEAENLDGNIIKYKSIDSYVELFCIIFQTRDYYLKFFNDGNQVFHVPMMFSRNFLLEQNKFFQYYSFKQIKKYNYSDKFDVLSSPFIFTDKEFFEYDAYFMAAFALVVVVVVAFLGFKYPCYICCQCCKNFE